MPLARPQYLLGCTYALAVFRSAALPLCSTLIPQHLVALNTLVGHPATRALHMQLQSLHQSLGHAPPLMRQALHQEAFCAICTALGQCQALHSPSDAPDQVLVAAGRVQGAAKCEWEELSDS